MSREVQGPLRHRQGTPHLPARLQPEAVLVLCCKTPEGQVAASPEELEEGPFSLHTPGDGRVVSNFIVSALQNKDITVFGDGNQTRQKVGLNPDDQP